MKKKKKLQKIDFREVHEMKNSDTGGLPYLIKLVINIPYMLTTYIDIPDKLVNGNIGLLKFIKMDKESNEIVRIWLEFDDINIGKITKSKFQSIILENKNLNKNWVPISKKKCIHKCEKLFRKM